MNPTPPKSPQTETLLGQLIAELVKFGGFPKDKASQYARILLPHITAYTAEECTKAQQETAKAYGGCTKCYGKGYATVIEYASGYDTDTDIGSKGGAIHYQKPVMKFCTCDRGSQLAQLKTKGAI